MGKKKKKVIYQGNVLIFFLKGMLSTERHGKERRKWENINETVKRTGHFFFS